jgi:hypothetical protein
MNVDLHSETALHDLNVLVVVSQKISEETRIVKLEPSPL